MHQGIWGHVVVEDWTMENAQVVCHQLNKPGVKSFKLLETDRSSEDRITWLKNVRCKGDEKGIMDCPQGVWIEMKNETGSTWKAVLECIPGKKTCHCLSAMKAVQIPPRLFYTVSKKISPIFPDAPLHHPHYPIFGITKAAYHIVVVFRIPPYRRSDSRRRKSRVLF
jgi:hypothetical protein